MSPMGKESKKKSVCMYMYNWFTLLYAWINTITPKRQAGEGTRLFRPEPGVWQSITSIIVYRSKQSQNLPSYKGRPFHGCADIYNPWQELHALGHWAFLILWTTFWLKARPDFEPQLRRNKGDHSCWKSFGPGWIKTEVQGSEGSRDWD